MIYGAATKKKSKMVVLGFDFGASSGGWSGGVFGVE